MRLLTHNYLQSNVKGTEKGYPLIIEATQIECEETPVDLDFVTTLLPKLQYSALRSAVEQIAPLCPDPPLPELPESLDGLDLDLDFEEGLDSEMDGLELQTKKSSSSSKQTQNETESNQTTREETETLLTNLHRVLFDIHVVEGHLVCPDTKRRFPISMGIPNMILHEDEI